MSIKVALAPYTMLLKLVGIVAVSGVLFVGGCNYGKSNQAATVATLQADLGAALQANKRYEDLNQERRRLDKLASMETARQEKAALEASGRVDNFVERTDNEQVHRDAALSNAMRDPKCSELMEMMVCPTVPLP